MGAFVGRRSIEIYTSILSNTCWIVNSSVGKGRRTAAMTNNPNELTIENSVLVLNEVETTMASNEEIIRNLYGVAEKEPKRFRSLFTENGYWWDVPAGVKYRGDEVARAADIYAAAFPDMHRELSDLYFDGDVVVVQLSLNGTHQGDLPMGLGTIPATGKEIHVPCIDVFHLEDGKVSAFDCHYAGTILLGQLGVLGNLEASLKK
jgi:predicted ester cyclase